MPLGRLRSVRLRTEGSGRSQCWKSSLLILFIDEIYGLFILKNTALKSTSCATMILSSIEDASNFNNIFVMIYEWLKPGTGTAMSVELDYSIQFEGDEQPGGENLKRAITWSPPYHWISLTCTQLENLAYGEWKEKGLLFDCSWLLNLFTVTGFEDARESQFKIPLGEWPSGTSCQRETVTNLFRWKCENSRSQGRLQLEVITRNSSEAKFFGFGRLARSWFCRVQYFS